MTLQIHNTLTNKTDTFKPLEDSKVTLYTCGPTVYNYPHVGNWAAYVYWDILVRILLAEGYQVERVMNITDVGHLVSDADEGEDKLEKGARREGKTAWEIAEFYAEDFVAGMEKLGLIPPEHLVKATDFIPQQLDLIRILKEKGYTYQTHDGIYFDTTKFPTYADFAHLDLDAQKAGARVEVNAEKHSPSDFALWKFTPAGQTRDMQWETPDDLLDLPRHESANERVTRGGAAPAETTALADIEDGADRAAGPAPSDLCGDSFGIDNDGSVDFNSVSSETVPNKRQESGNAASSPVMGFPGWHLECSAMAMSILGPTIDIHTGGIDHIPVHHTNEIAQSEAASGQRFANYWLHNNHIKSNGTKISKSLNNGYTLQDLEAEGFSPLDYRMFILQGQFTNEGNFTFENLEAAKNRLRGWRGYAALRHQTHDRLTDDSAKSDSNDNHVTLLAASGAVKEALANNLNTPAALSIIDDAFSQIDSHELDAIYQHGLTHFIETIDELLGLQLADSTPDITDEQKMLILERQRAREAKDWVKSDKLRDQLAAAKIALNDTPTGTIWSYL